MPDQTSLLFIWTDQQAVDTIGAYGNEMVETPNLDALAESGTVFRNAYCSEPICTPSRSTITTGKYPHTTGCTENNVPLAPDAKCFPELGDFNDYTTAFMGKWHLGDEVFAQHGFDEWISIADKYRGYFSSDRDDTTHSTYHEYLVSEGFEPDMTADDGFRYFSRDFAASLPEEHTKAAFLGREARRFIEEHRDEPFVLHVMFFEPHMPYTGPRDNQYNPRDVPLPSNFEHDGFEDQPLDVQLMRANIREGLYNPSPGLLGESPTEDDWRTLISNYWGLSSLVDTHVGHILDALDDCGRRDDTAVVFTSDHGDMMGSQGMVSKSTMFEESIKIPLITRFPAIDTPDEVTAPVSQVDLVPTLLDVMDQPQPEGLQGESWVPFLRGEDDLVNETVVVEWDGYKTGLQGGRSDWWQKEELPSGPQHPHYSDEYAEVWHEIADPGTVMSAMTTPVRTVITPEGWKLNYRGNGEHELYDLNDDPGETQNLAGDDSHTDVIDDLIGRLFEWQSRTRDPVYLP